MLLKMNLFGELAFQNLCCLVPYSRQVLFPGTCPRKHALFINYFTFHNPNISNFMHPSVTKVAAGCFNNKEKLSPGNGASSVKNSAVAISNSSWSWLIFPISKKLVADRVCTKNRPISKHIYLSVFFEKVY